MSLGTYADSSCTKKGVKKRVILTERKGMLNDEHRVLRLSKHASLKSNVSTLERQAHERCRSTACVESL